MTYTNTDGIGQDCAHMRILREIPVFKSCCKTASIISKTKLVILHKASHLKKEHCTFTKICLLLAVGPILAFVCFQRRKLSKVATSKRRRK